MVDAIQLKLFNDKFIENVDKNSKDFNQRLIEYVLSNLEDKKLPKGAFLANLENEIQKILNKSGYIQSANDFIGNAQTIKTEMAKTYGANVKSLFDKSERFKFFSEYAENQITKDGLKNAVIKKIADKIRVASFSDYDIDSIKALVKGTGDVLPRYVNQVSVDTLSQIHGALQSEIQIKYKPSKGRWIGSEIETTRPFCKHMKTLTNPISRETLQGVLNKYIPDGKPKPLIGSGMIEGTNIDNFAINRGGYNCGHLWVWIID